MLLHWGTGEDESWGNCMCDGSHLHCQPGINSNPSRLTPVTDSLDREEPSPYGPHLLMASHLKGHGRSFHLLFPAWSHSRWQGQLSFAEAFLQRYQDLLLWDSNPDWRAAALSDTNSRSAPPWRHPVLQRDSLRWAAQTLPVSHSNNLYLYENVFTHSHGLVAMKQMVELIQQGS